jgi:hypothetical protein
MIVAVHQGAETGEDFWRILFGFRRWVGRTETAGPAAGVRGGGEAGVLRFEGAAAAAGGTEGVLFHSESRGAFGAAAEDGDVADEGREVF